MVKRRPALGWARAFDVRVAVHDPQLWREPTVKAALEDALQFLTGDTWTFSFFNRLAGVPPVRQAHLNLEPTARLIMPYSDGLNSRAVAAIVGHAERGDLVRVRLGSGAPTIRQDAGACPLPPCPMR